MVSRIAASFLPRSWRLWHVCPPQLGRPVLVGWTLVSTVLLVSYLLGQEVAQEEEELVPYRPGIVVELHKAGNPVCQRVVPQVMWQSQQPVPDGFHLRWRGVLMSEQDGNYRLHVYTDMAIRLTVRESAVLETTAGAPAWHSTPDIPLTFDWHRLVLDVLSSGVGTLSLYWSGPHFSLEPLTDRHLMHDRQEASARQWERGRLLAVALRCDACHGGKQDDLPRAPSLAKLPGNIYPQWVAEWLTAVPPPLVPGADAHAIGEATTSDTVAGADVEQFHGRRMPYFRMGRRDAMAMAVYLTQGNTATGAGKVLPPAEMENHDGRQLFLTVGCLACHGMDSYGDSGLFGGGDLTKIAEKRPLAFLEGWLTAPQQYNPHHRMPVFDLTAAERRALSRFLATRGSPPATEATWAQDESLRRLGQQQYAAYRCGACHQSPDDAPPVLALPPLGAQSRWMESCAGVPPRAAQPAYGLPLEDQRALAVYYSVAESLQGVMRGAEEVTERLLQHNCVRCHGRGHFTGLAGAARQVFESFPELAPHAAALIPPSLNSVGDKLQEPVLQRILAGNDGRRREWLLVRMPKYAFTPTAARELIDELVRADRIPPQPPDTPPAAAGDFPEPIAARLVTADGFGCTSCHSVGKVKAPNAPLQTIGPNLARLQERIRRPWFERWVRNPSRIIPRMEMPAIQSPVPGVLDDDLAAQLAAVWDVLNRPAFRPPEPNPVRVVRRANVPSLIERAIVLTDVLDTPQARYVQPLLIALPNRHNVLFDLAEARLAEWWIGDAARQRTQGKSWFWEAGSPSLVPANSPMPEIALNIGERLITASRRGQFVTYFDWLEHKDGGVEFAYRLLFSIDGRSHVVHVRQLIQPAWGTISGFTRTVVIDNIPSDVQVVFRPWATTAAARSAAANDQGYALDERHTVWFDIQSASELKSVEQGAWYLQPRQGRVEILVRYATNQPVDKFLVEPTAPRPRSAENLPVVPGFQAVRLPLTNEIMPTGLTFDERGRLLVTCLKGRVWRAEDRDGDGWEDDIVPISDELAAPYGIAVPGQAIDVINKYALLRLIDKDQDGRIDRMETLAAGWGHTDDYHDWAVGLPTDGHGGYFVALPCQQDDRPWEATRYRGALLHLRPSSADATDEWPMAIEPVSAGHRFPMGLARNRLGWLFATDNQGNYNPFNELNFVTPGAHFGFVNAWEQRAGVVPPTHTPPAINIPHPWTRSVNGICFLETPPQLEASGPVFGPFEGHLLGCEYDTRRLIRMTVEQVGSVIQGAAYPLSLDRWQPGQSFLGPVVCAVSPQGHIYVGSIRDSGWGGGNNIGEIVRLVPQWHELPPGIRQVRAAADGFLLEFTQPVNRSKAADPSSYVIQSYRRTPTPAYGGPDMDRRTERVAAVWVSEDARRAYVKLAAMREGFVYEFHLKNLAIEPARMFFPQDAYYTLHVKGQQEFPQR